MNGPHQGALVDTPRGEWWFLHFQDAGIYGRIVHLNPVTWVDDWPLMGKRANEREPGEPLLLSPKPVGPNTPSAIPQTSDEFDGRSSDYSGNRHANHEDRWFSLAAAKGTLRLLPQPSGNDFSRIPNLLLQKLPASSFTAETVVRLEKTAPETRAGLVVMGESHAALAVEAVETALRVSLVIDNAVVESRTANRGPVVLRVSMETGGKCHFSYLENGGSAASSAGFKQARALIGAKVGVFATAPAEPRPRSRGLREWRFSTLPAR